MKTKVKKLVKKNKLAESSETAKMMVFLEDMRDGIRLVAEGHSILERGQSNLENGICRLEKDLGDFKKETMSSFKLAFEHFSNIEDETMEIKTEIKELRKELKDKVELNRLVILEERVSAIEMRQMVLRDASEKNIKQINHETITTFH